MKNQNDIIVIGVCAFLSIVAALCMFFMKREPIAPPAPTAVITSAPTYPTNTAPAMAASLSGGSNAGGSAMGGGFGGGMMGGMGGPPPGVQMMGGRAGGSARGAVGKGGMPGAQGKD